MITATSVGFMGKMLKKNKKQKRAPFFQKKASKPFEFLVITDGGGKERKKHFQQLFN